MPEIASDNSGCPLLLVLRYDCCGVIIVAL